jgi:hypothetical protein
MRVDFPVQAQLAAEAELREQERVQAALSAG